MLTTSKTIFNKPLTQLQPNIPSRLPSEETFDLAHELNLECGETLQNVSIRYSTYGDMNAQASNVIWICHALTADANPLEWWPGLVGQGCLYNPDDYFIVCANVIGSHYGSTSPLDCVADKRFEHFPCVSIRDNIKAFEQLKEHLRIAKIHTLIGGSMGGHQALEWAIMNTEICENLIVLASSAALSPWATAFNQSQRLALESDQSWGEESQWAAQKGLKAARSIALLSYRNQKIYDATQADIFDFKRQAKASSYQNYQGEKLVNRFNAYSYHALTKTMDSHDVGRNRGGIEAALKLINADTLVIGIESDLLFPLEESKKLAQFIPNAQLEILNSDYGHDGFLIESEKISGVIQQYYRKKSQYTSANKSIGLYGFGCVGQGFYQLLNESSGNKKLKAIAVKNAFKKRTTAHDLLVTNHHQLIHDKDVDTIIELIDDANQAYNIAKATISQNKSFISANKKMIAYRLPEIIKWNQTHDCSILYEAAVAGSIPILRNLDTIFNNGKTHSIKAIVNGSSNYILTQMFKNQCAFESALKSAQDLGYAESNPTEDVAGFDAKYKAVILATHAFGFLIHPDAVRNYGIQNIQANDITFAQSRKLSIKHVIELRRINAQKITISVMPHFVGEADEMAKTEGCDNIITVNNNHTDYFFKGAGAGSIATGSAVMADLAAATAHQKYAYHIDDKLSLDASQELKLYINTKHYDDSIGGKIIEEGEHFVIIETNQAALNAAKIKHAFIAAYK